MRYILSTALVFLLFVVAPVKAAQVEASRSTLELELGTGQMLRLAQSANSIYVANPEVADVQLQSPNTLHLFARTLGETNVFVMDKSENILIAHRVVVSHNVTRLQELIGKVRPRARVDATTVNNSLVLTGLVSSAEAAEDIRGLAASITGDPLHVINHLRIAQPSQVNLRVRIAEVSRDVSKQLGFNWTLARSVGSLALGLTTAGGSLAGGGALTAAGSLFGADVNLVVDALDDQGLISVLAEPNLTAMSGESANFLAGGEFPIPIPQDDGSLTIVFKEFGVSLSFVPVVLDDGRINIHVATEVSQLSETGAVNFAGFTVPALTTRKAETIVNLGSGQSFAIAGLLQNTTNQDVNKFPGLGDLPVLGTLFRSSTFQRDESELVVIATPYLVRPVSNQLASPTDGYRPATAGEHYVQGRMHTSRLADRGEDPLGAGGRGGPVGPAGFILR